MLKKVNSNQIFFYDSVDKKNSYGTEFTKLSSSMYSGEGKHTWYDSRTSSNHTIVFNLKSNTTIEKQK